MNEDRKSVYLGHAVLRSSAVSLVALSVGLASGWSSAADFSMTATDTGTTLTSFNSAGKWSPAGAPVAGVSPNVNNYFTNGFTIWTPTGGTAPTFTFKGDTLQLRASDGTTSANNVMSLRSANNATIKVASLQAYDGSSLVLGVNNVTNKLDGMLTVSGTVTLNAAAGTRVIDVIGKISGTGDVVIASTSTTSAGGVVQYSMAGTDPLKNNYSGNTAVSNRAILRMNAVDAMPFATTDGDLIVNTGGTFRLNGKATTIQGLSGTGAVDNTNAAGATLTIQGDSDTANNVFSGVISDGTGGGALGLLKDGAVTTQTLSGANTYTGLTTVKAGTLAIRSNAALGATGADKGTTISGTGTLDLANGITSAEALTLVGRSDTTAHVNNSGGSNVLSATPTTITLTDGGGANNFNLTTAAGDLTINGAIDGSAAGAVSALNLDGAAGTSGRVDGALTMQGGAANTLTQKGAGAWTIKGAVNNLSTLNVSAGSLTLDSDTDVSGTTTLSGGQLGLNGTGASTTGTLAVKGGSLVINQGTGELVVTSDYTNTGFGSGKDFDARANVSGPGAIVSKDMDNGGTNQGLVVDADPVTAGDTTMTLNVHTSSSINANGLTKNGSDVATGNYSISNTGTVTRIRGGVDDTAITDTRLSGTGVSGAAVETATKYSEDGIAAGDATANLSVTFTGDSAGALSGQSLTISDNFGETQQLAITGAAYDLAQATAVGPIVTVAAQHVGGSNTAPLLVENIAPEDADYTETLTGVLKVDANGTGGGAFGPLVAGDAGHTFNVGVATGTGGHITSNANLDATSNEVGDSGLGNTVLNQQSFTIEGDVFNYAASKISSKVTVAAQHVGDNERAAVSIENSGPDSSYTEMLSAKMTTKTQAIGSGSVSNLLAGDGPDTSLLVGVDTSGVGGARAGTATLELTSNEVMSSGLGNTSLGSAQVEVVGDVYNYANGAFGSHSGAGSLTGSGVAYTLDFGNVVVGTGTKTANLAAKNTAPSAIYSDLLTGDFAFAADDPFNLIDFDPFSGLAGLGSHALTVEMLTGIVGIYTQTVTFTWYGTNQFIDGGWEGAPQDIVLTINGNVVEAPEPGILWLMGSASLLGWFSSRRKAAARPA